MSHVRSPLLSEQAPETMDRETLEQYVKDLRVQVVAAVETRRAVARHLRGQIADLCDTAQAVVRHADRHGFINVNESPMFDLMAAVKKAGGDLT